MTLTKASIHLGNGKMMADMLLPIKNNSKFSPGFRTLLSPFAEGPGNLQIMMNHDLAVVASVIVYLFSSKYTSVVYNVINKIRLLASLQHELMTQALF